MSNVLGMGDARHWSERQGGAGDVVLAEQGDADPRPSLGSGYNRLKPVMPHKQIVPAGAQAELRLGAKKEDVIPLYPY